MELKLISSKFIRINATRNPDFSGKIKLDTNVNIKSIEKYELTSSKRNSLKVEAAFVINYYDFGKIEIEGILYLSVDEKSLKEILRLFNGKKYNSPELIGIMNLVLQKFSIKAFEIEEELNLPIHIKLPSLQIKKD